MSESLINCLVVLASKTQAARNSCLQLLHDVTGKQYDNNFEEEYLYRKWEVNNKYFTASVNICVCGKEHIESIEEENSKQWEAVVIVTDAAEESSLATVKDISSKCSCESLEICLLFDVGQGKDTSHHHEAMQKWCIDNEYELICLHNDNDDGDNNEDEDDRFKEKVGIARIKEALNSHVWSDHTRKGEEKQDATRNNEVSAKQIMDGFEQGQSFEELFQKFSDMKEKAKNLEGDAKKEYAAQVALSFLEALGIDEDSD